MRFSRLVVSGALLLLAPAAAHAGETGAPEKEQKVGAQKTFDAGSRLYDAHRYEEALAAFRASYQIVHSPNSHLMVARALRDLGRNVEAYAEYDAVVREAQARGEKYESAGHAATEERDEVRPKIALLTVRVAGDATLATVKVGETTLPTTDLEKPLPHEPGAIVVTASQADGSAARNDVTLEAGGASEVTLTLALPAPASPAPVPVEPPPPPPPPPPRSGAPLRTVAYVAGGIGVVGLATFGILGAMSNSKYASLDSACPDHRCDATKQGDVDAGRRDQTIANVGLVIGAIGVGAGVTLFVVSSRGPKDRLATATANVRLAVRPGTLSLDGRF